MIRNVNNMMSLLLCLLLVAALPTQVLADGDQTVLVFVIDQTAYTVNGTPSTMDVAPQIIEGRTMLPIRFVAEPLGADVGWDGTTKTVTVSIDDTLISLQIGNPVAQINGVNTPIDADNPNVKPVIVNSRTLLPVRFVTESIGSEVGWDPATRAVTITKPTVVADKDEGEDVGDDEATTSLLPVDMIDPQVLQDAIARNASSRIAPIPNFTIDKLYNNPIDGIDPSVFLRPDNPDWASAPKNSINTVQVSEADIPVVMRLGRGYNVFGKYASVDSLKQSVLDNGKLVADGKLERIRLDQAESSQVTSESIRKYSESFSKRASGPSGYSMFGGSIASNFSSERTSERNNYFSTYMYLVKKYGVYVKAGTDYKQYLTTEARSQINDTNVSPEQVFNTFGQYVLVDSVSGGRVDYSITSSSEASTSFEEFKKLSKGDFNALVMMRTGLQTTTTTTSRESYDADKEEKLNSFGGSNTLNISQFLNDSQALVKWEATLEKNGTLVEFGNTSDRALIPIWELADSQSRTDQLKAAFEQQEQQLEQSLPEQLYLTNIVITYSRSADRARELCPPGYTLIDRDLNKDAGGRYMYLCYLLGNDKSAAITDFYMQRTSRSKGNATEMFTHNGNYQEYTRLAVDLNKRAGGDYVYLWYSFGKETEPIKDIAVFFDAVPAEGGWEPVYWLNTQTAANANHRAGGKKVYIAVKR